MINTKTLTRLARDVMVTADYEILEEEALVQMVQSAEAGLTVEESRRQFPDLWQYFHFYPEMKEQYDLLLEMIELEAAGEFEPLQTIPPAPDQATMWDRFVNVLVRLFPGFGQPSAALTPALVRGQRLDAVEVELDDDYRLELIVEISDRDPQQRRLNLLVDSDDSELVSVLEGSSVWLQLGDAGPTIQEQSLDELGETSLELVAPGSYTLRLQLRGQLFVVTGFEVP